MADDDGWTGSMKKPWLNPPAKHDLGVKRGHWRLATFIVVAAVVAVAVGLLLVNAGRLDRGWAYAVLPVAIIAAAATRIVTAVKVSNESKGTE